MTQDILNTKIVTQTVRHRQEKDFLVEVNRIITNST